MSEFGTIGKIVGGIVGAGVVFTALGCFYSIPQQDVGVLTRFGKYEQTVMPGLNFKAPWIESVVKYPTSNQNFEIDSEQVNTTDNQQAWLTVNVQYELTPEGAENIFKKYPDYPFLLRSLAADLMKQVLGKYQIQDIPSNRNEIEQEIKSKVTAEAERLYKIRVSEIQLKGIKYNQYFDDAITRMTKKKADVEVSKQAMQQAQYDADRAVTVAKGEAQAVRTQAQGQADATTINAKAIAGKISLEGKAKADAIKAQAQALANSNDYVDLIKAQKWDGQLPTSLGVGGPSAMPMLNMPLNGQGH